MIQNIIHLIQTSHAHTILHNIVIKLPATDSGGLTNVKLEFSNGPMSFNSLVTDATATTYDKTADAPILTADSSETDIQQVI